MLLTRDQHPITKYIENVAAENAGMYFIQSNLRWSKTSILKKNGPNTSNTIDQQRSTKEVTMINILYAIIIMTILILTFLAGYMMHKAKTLSILDEKLRVIENKLLYNTKPNNLKTNMYIKGALSIIDNLLQQL